VVSDPAQLVRLPLADNAYVYYMLGRADDWQLPEYRTVSMVNDQAERNQPILETFALASEATRDTGIETHNVSRNETILSVKVASVPLETKQQILRLIEKTSLSWSAIAEQVRMASEKYELFRAVVTELGYDTSIRRGRKGGM
jgi:hypothetical protein